MEDWTSGYVADIGYTYGYYAELNPLAARLALLVSGIVPPTVTNACELGFGQGVSINAHAAASTARWFGTDFNPGQAAFAQELAAAAQSKASLHDEAFDEFCSRTDLPDMDFIGLHGIWSWISDANRQVIVDFVRRKLKVGGVLYISYNTQPGWAAAAPLRDLLTDHAETMGAPGQGIVSRIDAALNFTEKLLATNPRYLSANPQVAERLKKIMTQDRHYVAHEYFNRDWEPMSFAKFSNWVTPAKVTFAASAALLEHVDSLNLTPEQQALVKDIPDPRFRQSVRDFCINAQFRRDYWIRGARPLVGAAQREAIDRQLVVLTKRPQDVSLNIGEAKLNEAVYLPFLEQLADGKPKSIGQIAAALAPKSISIMQVVQALTVLAGKGDLQAAQPAEETEAAKRTAGNLNKHLMNQARMGGPVVFLASPVTGGAVGASRFDQIFLSAIHDGEKSLDGWVKRGWQELARQGQRLTRDGKPIQSEADSLARMKEFATDFSEKRLAVYRGLGIA